MTQFWTASDDELPEVGSHPRTVLLAVPQFPGLIRLEQTRGGRHAHIMRPPSTYKRGQVYDLQHNFTYPSNPIHHEQLPRLAARSSCCPRPASERHNPCWG